MLFGGGKASESFAEQANPRSYRIPYVCSLLAKIKASMTLLVAALYLPLSLRLE
jgi:hypothetical protein